MLIQQIIYAHLSFTEFFVDCHWSDWYYRHSISMSTHFYKPIVIALYLRISDKSIPPRLPTWTCKMLENKRYSCYWSLNNRYFNGQSLLPIEYQIKINFIQWIAFVDVSKPTSRLDWLEFAIEIQKKKQQKPTIICCDRCNKFFSFQRKCAHKLNTIEIHCNGNLS